MQANPHQTIFLLGKKAEPFSYLEVIEECRDGGQFLSSDEGQEYLACYDRDSQSLFTMPPLIVFRPNSIESIAPFVKSCRKWNIPIVPRCGGSGLIGSAVASQGGAIVLTHHLRSILDFDSKNGIVTVEPGVTVNQLNQFLEKEKWCFPVEIQSSGSAGLAGCLSAHAQGYHQVCDYLLNQTKDVIFIDGKGEKIKAPSSLLCGSEGVFGIVTQMTLHLVIKPQKRVVLRVSIEWEALYSHLNHLKTFLCLASLIWGPEGHVTIVLEGDAWRVDASLISLEKYFENISYLASDWILTLTPPPKLSSFTLSHAIPPSVLSFLLPKVEQISADLALTYYFQFNALDGTLYIVFSSSEKAYAFSKQIEKFLVFWIPILESAGGFINGRHGIGPYLRHYIPPFYREEDFHFLEQLCQMFDPNQLFRRNRFLPTSGKSLEKVPFHAH